LALCVGLAFVAFFHPLLLPRVGLQKSASPTFQTSSAAGRAVYQEQALALWAEHRWQGVGLGNFAWHSARLLQYDWRDLRGDHVHHLYLLAGVETGTIGLGLFLLSQALTFGLLGRRAWRGELDPIGAALAAGVVGWLAIGWFDHYPWTQFGYQLLFWGISACILGRKTHMPTPPSSK
jgi:O-antigen ligase